MDTDQIRDPEPAPSVPSAAPPNLTEAIDRLMAHPELISMVASAMGMGGSTPPTQKPSTTDEPTPPKEPEAAASTATVPPSPALPTGALPDNLSTLAPLLGVLSSKGEGKGAPKDDPRACLLRALKPYVNRNRCEAIDTILQISRISDLLRHMH